MKVKQVLEGFSPLNAAICAAITYLAAAAPRR